MRFDPNDLRLTAYVLGELDERERATIESLLEGSEEARRTVNEIRETAEALAKELEAERCPAPAPATREAVLRALEAAPAAKDEPAGKTSGAPSAGIQFRLSRWSMAAALLGVAGLGVWFLAFGDGSLEVRNGIEAPGVDAAAIDGDERRLDAIGYRLRTLGYISPGDRDRLDRFGGEATQGSAAGTEGRLETLGYVEPEAGSPSPALSPEVAERLRELGYLDGRAEDDEPVDFLVQPSGASDRSPTAGYRFGAKAVRYGDGKEATVARAEVRAIETRAPRAKSAERLRREMGELRESLVEIERIRKAPRTEASHTESYDAIDENPFIAVEQDPRSTFSIDVDTASYANVRRFLDGGTMPPPGAVRIEEMVNYFSYDYPLSTDAPFSATLDVAECPWKPGYRLVRVGLKGREIPERERPPLNLVFLLDVSGSMNRPNKLPLVIESMKLLVESLHADDRVAIVVYAGSSGLVLPPTRGLHRGTILSALDRLRAGGSTNGAAGIRLAYDTAASSFVDGGVNRVILATDGDFNVGTTNRSELVALIEERAKSGIELTALGFGMGNLKDATLEQLAGRGNGNYGYIDSLYEARKWFVDQVSGSLVTIARDVKIQVEFNPQEVEGYRLIGYENRKMAHRDFHDDTKDAGEIGAGHTVTALYEVVPAGVAMPGPKPGVLRYQEFAQPSAAARSGEMLTLQIRYKEPDSPRVADERRNGAYDRGDAYTDTNRNGAYDLGEPYEDRPVAPPVGKSRLLTFHLFDGGTEFARTDPDFQFAAAVAAFGMVLRGSEHAGQATYDLVLELARAGLGRDVFGYRRAFLEMVERAKQIDRRE